MPYTDRRLVIEGPLPFTASQEGALPIGMEFDLLTGILSGTPEESGEFPFSVTVDDSTNPALTKIDVLIIAEAGVELPPSYVVNTQPQPVAAGTTSGNGSYEPNSEITVEATPTPGYHFVSWTDHGVVVSTQSSHTFNLGDVNRSLVAHFVMADVPTPIEIAPWHHSRRGLCDGMVARARGMDPRRKPESCSRFVDKLDPPRHAARWLAPCGSGRSRTAESVLPTQEAMN